jgi:hypothetical protein
MNRKKALIAIAVIVVAGIAFTLYMLNMPARDVQGTDSDYQIPSTALVQEYLDDAASANAKYLDASGESTILEVTGTIADISRDFNDQVVILLQSDDDPAGVSCTFTLETNASTDGLSVGKDVVIKGVIRSGAAYDEDLEMFEPVIIEKSDLFDIL